MLRVLLFSSVLGVDGIALSTLTTDGESGGQEETRPLPSSYLHLEHEHKKTEEGSREVHLVGDEHGKTDELLATVDAAGDAVAVSSGGSG